MVRGCVSASWQLVVVAVLAGRAAAAGPEASAQRGKGRPKAAAWSAVREARHLSK
jgi:hypothetical protein